MKTPVTNQATPSSVVKFHPKGPRKRGEPIDLTALSEVRSLLQDASRQRDLLIEHLHVLQDHFGCLHKRHLKALAHEMKLSSAEVYEVATFYHHFDYVNDGDAAPAKLTVRVCESVSCSLAGAESLINTLESITGEDVRVQRVPCVGRCETAPVAVVGTNPIAHATAEDVIKTIDANEIEHKPSGWQGLQAYLDEGGYQLFERSLNGDLNFDNVIATLKDAKLRGLGGAGFPVGLKWEIVRGYEGPRMMAVNIDEGEPGTFKDRHYLERRPHQFIEGMLLASQVVGTEKIYIYLRDEYAGIRHLLQQELEQVKARWGAKLPEISLRRGAGAYICGEESAMIESIEGKRGMPRLRPPFVAEVGLFGRPTLEHNMESLYWVPTLIEKGAEWFSQEGRHERTGLRSFSVSGRVKNPGVHLAPAGITIKELIEEYCGGMLEGHHFYGYLPGGASGGILPATMGDIPLDFDTLNQYGCFIGSAAVIVFSDQDSARDIALNTMHFFAHESCGQCTPCRVGTEKASQLMTAEQWDGDLLDDLAQVMRDASICGLGQAAPNPMQCVMKYFPEEVK